MTTGSQLQNQLARPNQVLTFSRSDTMPQWTSIGETERVWTAMTALGTDIYACVWNGDIYKQTNGTGAFVALNQTSRQWFAMATLGNDVYASVYGGDIFRQTNGTGNFVALGQTTRNWTSLARLGNDLYASTWIGDIFRQTNGTGDFVALGQTSRSWSRLASVGNDLYATVDFGDIYKLTNGIGNFEPLGQTARRWFGIAGQGNDLYACVFSGDIYKQTNGTGAFVALGQTTRQWNHVFALGNNVYCLASAIFTGTMSNTSIYRLTIQPQSERIFNFAGHNLQTGDQVFQSSSSPTALTKKFVIRVDANNFKFATTSQNATNGIGELTDNQFGLPLQTRISTDLGRTMTDFGTSFFVNSSVWRRSSSHAGASSTVGFSINTPVSIDWTYPATSLSSLNSLSNVVGLSTEDEATIFAILCPPRTTNSQFLIASPSSTLVQTVAAVTGVTNISGHKGRITITSERRITFQIATLTGTTYTTVWTSEIQAASLPLLYFYTTFCYSQERITDCKITYL